MARLALVTGASGFIGKYVALALLARGYDVRGTVRTLAKAEPVRSLAAAAGHDPARLAFVTCDLASDEGWADAVAGCDVVHHVASPFPLSLPRDRDEVIAPARDGTVRVLRAANAAGVPRIVLTSSIVAVIYPRPEPAARRFTETHWTDPSRTDVTAYVASKAIAEKAAWDLMRDAGREHVLAVINPGLVLGPALDDDLSSSHRIVVRMARGEFPAAPRAGYPIVDVRDVAELHAIAGEHDGAGGERFLCADVAVELLQMGRMIGEALPDLRWRLPRFNAPDVVVRGMALVDPSVAAVLPDLGGLRHVSAKKARETFGFSFRPAREAVTSAALSLRTLKLI